MSDPLTFLEFVAQADGWRRRNTWVREPGLSMYVRRPWSGLRPPGIDVELANIEADEPGQGAFTRFLDTYEPRFGFWVPNIINERLPGFLERRGYVRHQPWSPDVTYYRLRPEG